MKRLISDALDFIDDSYIAEALQPSAETEKGGNTSSVKAKKGKLFKIALIAAAVASLLGVTAAAASYLIDSPEKALKTARHELAAMQELGILSREISLSDEPNDIVELPSYTDSRIYPGRQFKSRYSVREWGGKYSVSLDVDMATGKVFNFTVEAKADENDQPLPDRVFETEHGEKQYYYSNFEDLFDPGMTVDTYCSALAEYWGYSGYTLGSTDDDFYNYNAEAPKGNTLLSEICDGAYLTVYFEGDDSGVPMYIQLMRFPGRICLMAGTNHAVG